MILGTTRVGDPVELASGEVYARQITASADGTCLAAIRVLLDAQGSGGGSGSPQVQPIVFGEDGTLLTAGPAVPIAPGSAAQWWTLRLDDAGLRLTGSPWVGLRVAGSHNAVRLYAVSPARAPVRSAITASIPSSLPVTPGPAEWVNLLTNPTGDSGSTADWASYSSGGTASLLAVTTPVRHGTHSFKLTRDTDGLGPQLILMFQRRPASPGQVLSAAAEFRADTVGRAVQTVVAFLDSSDAQIGPPIVSPDLADSPGAWTRCAVENITAPAGTASVGLHAYVIAAAEGESHYIDGLILVEGDTVPAYFDGSTNPPLTRWLGTPHLSQSAYGRFDGNIVAEVFSPWNSPEVPDDALADLPWELSQRAFSTTGRLRATRREATAGWHGTDTDAKRGARCIVRSDGPLADLVGERLRIVRRVGTLERAVYVYCHDEVDFGGEAADEDLSLTRRAFLALAPLALDAAAVTVEVLA